MNAYRFNVLCAKVPYGEPANCWFGVQARTIPEAIQRWHDTFASDWTFVKITELQQVSE